MLLPPTEKNLYLHILRAHLQVILAKAADQQAPPELDITQYGWEIKDGLPVPRIADQLPGPRDLMDVVRCSCKAKGKACSTGSCSCQKGRMSCTVYCTCGCSDECFNPFKSADEQDNTAMKEIRAEVEPEDADQELHSCSSDEEWE
jgi:hypothetical protein